MAASFNRPVARGVFRNLRVSIAVYPFCVKVAMRVAKLGLLFCRHKKKYYQFTLGFDGWKV